MTSKNVAKGARRIVYSSAGFPSVSRMISAQGSRPRNQPPFIAMSQWKTSLECDDHVLMSFFGSGIPSRATHTAVLSHPQPRKKIPELNYVRRFRISATACFLAFFPGWHSPSSTLSPEAGERWKPQISLSKQPSWVNPGTAPTSSKKHAKPASEVMISLNMCQNPQHV